jgi:hypothetical protein
MEKKYVESDDWQGMDDTRIFQKPVYANRGRSLSEDYVTS